MVFGGNRLFWVLQFSQYLATSEMSNLSKSAQPKTQPHRVHKCEGTNYASRVSVAMQIPFLPHLYIFPPANHHTSTTLTYLTFPKLSKKSTTVPFLPENPAFSRAFSAFFSHVFAPPFLSSDQAWCGPPEGPPWEPLGLPPGGPHLAAVNVRQGIP